MCVCVNLIFLFFYGSSDKCKVMQSKMKPVWLNFDNMDPLGDRILHIFKNGDGECINIKTIIHSYQVKLLSAVSLNSMFYVNNVLCANNKL